MSQSSNSNITGSNSATGSDVAQLTYNIASMRLYGVVDTITIDTLAASGGRGGSKKSGVTDQVIMNNPFLTGLKETKKSMGGPLPQGYYTLKLHESKNNWIRLIPEYGNVMHNRDGFAIHGRGPIGSQGCIVPGDFSIVLNLCELITKRKQGNKSPIVLKVFATGDLDYFQTLIEKRKSTA